MSVRSAQAITVTFITETAADADSLPTGVLVVSGTDNGATVTVTHIDTGRYTAAVTLPTLAVGDIVEIVVSATVASAAEKFVAWRDTADIAVSSAGGVTLADGVAHGGTPGASTATLAMQKVNVTSPSGDAVAFICSDATPSAGGAALFMDTFSSDPTINIYREGNSGGDPYGTVLIDSSGNSAALALRGSGTAAGLQIYSSADGINISVSGHGVSILAGSGKKALLLAGDAATDSFAIAAGAGSPVDIFHADGSVNADLTATGLDAIPITAPTGPATTFRGMLVQTWRRLFKGSAKSVSGHTVKTFADDGTTVVTTQAWTDDNAGNETQGGAT